MRNTIRGEWSASPREGKASHPSIQHPPIPRIFPTSPVCSLTHPTSNGGMQNGSSVGIRTRRIHAFASLAPELSAQSVIIDKISAPELKKKFIKSALLVGLGTHARTPISHLSCYYFVVCPHVVCLEVKKKVFFFTTHFFLAGNSKWHP